MTFGEKLFRARKACNISQSDLVLIIKQRFPDVNISQSRLSMLEKQRYAPEEAILKAFSEILGWSVVYFLDAQSNVVKSEQVIHIYQDAIHDILSRLDKLETEIAQLGGGK